MKETFPERVVYILSIPRAASQDSGTYECSVTDKSGEVRVKTVAVTVFGESSPRNLFLDTINEFPAEL